jgi:hypothetical protein
MTEMGHQRSRYLGVSESPGTEDNRNIIGKAKKLNRGKSTKFMSYFLFLSICFNLKISNKIPAAKKTIQKGPKMFLITIS